MPRLGDRAKGHTIGKATKWAWFEWCACLDCGKERWVLLIFSKPKVKRCRKCYGKYHNLDNSWSWRGGRTTCMGYIAVKRPDHPRAHIRTGYVLEHILIWEEAHNRLAPRGSLIHHINGIKTDNRPCNLVLLSPRGHNHEHQTLSQSQQQRIRELEVELENIKTKMNGGKGK